MIPVSTRRRFALVTAAAALTACASTPEAVVTGPRPAVCQKAEFRNVADLPLPPPRHKPQAAADKGQPLRVADAVPIGGGLADVGKWSDSPNGWRNWRLRFTSDGARSLALKLQPIDFPPEVEAWVCSPGGGTRFGPYVGKGPTGLERVWTPAVKGGELWLEVVAPAAIADSVSLGIAEAYVGFR